MKEWSCGGTTYLLNDDVDLSDHVTHSNLQASVRALAGRTLVEIFGEEVPLDVVKFTGIAPDTCGNRCFFTVIWRKDHDETRREHYAHVVHRSCERHAHLLDDHGAHISEVLAEVQHKELSRMKFAKAHSIEDHNDISWSIDKHGNIDLQHEKFGTMRLSGPRLKVDKPVIAISKHGV